ncbi:MAG TPA: thermonuclease family protein [Solirubrobacteraceae bacterium]|nr:thermonuclease family protein [Solirubrobacteraceae bacterium]
MRRRSATLWIIGFLALAAWAGWDLVPGELSGRTGGADLEGRVVAVVDGDTVRVRVDGREETVRYIGVDTPETKRPGSPVECFGPAASAANERLVDGRKVRLEVDDEQRDRYDRLLAYVYRAGDGRFVNEALVRGGYARPLAIEPNVDHAEGFSALADEAREAGRGLWSACGS